MRSGVIWLTVGVIACAGYAASPRTGYVDVDHGRLYYEERGAGPVVVLLQGGQLPLEMWDDQFELLSKNHRVIRYDARGFGRSSAKRGPYAYHEDFHALLQSLGVKRASFVGLSLGGRVAVDFALEHPAMVEKLVLAGPGLSGFQFSAPDSAWMASLYPPWNARDSVRLSLLWLESGYMKPAMRDSALATRLRRLMALNASLWMQPDSERVLQPPALPNRLAQLRVPTLVILGSADVPDIHAIVDSITRLVPGVKRVVIDDAGHMVNMEKPAEFNRALLAFLDGR